MKKIWQLYILFVAFFVFGDLISTFVIIEEKREVAAGIREPDMSDECAIRLPPECDRGYMISNVEKNPLFKFGLAKILIGILGLSLVFLDKRYILLAITAYSFMITTNNLSILFFPYRELFIAVELMGFYAMIKYFTWWEDDRI